MSDQMMFPLDFDPSDSDTLREQMETIRRVQQLQEKGDRLMAVMSDLYDLQEARDWKGNPTSDEKALIGEAEGLRTDLHRLNGQVAEINAAAEAALHAETHAQNERRAAQIQEEVEESNRKAQEEWDKEAAEAKKRSEEAQAQLQADTEVEPDFTVPESIHVTDDDHHNDDKRKKYDKGVVEETAYVE